MRGRGLKPVINLVGLPGLFIILYLGFEAGEWGSLIDRRARQGLKLMVRIVMLARATLAQR